MPITQPQAHQIAHLLGQYQDVARLVVEAGQAPMETVAALQARLGIGNPLGGAVFGFTALSFVYTYDAVVKEAGFPTAIVALVNLPVLNIRCNSLGANESAEQACLRHLRNCFAHGRFTYHGQGGEIELHDVNQNGAPTFDARCDVAHVVELAERVLVAAYNHAAAIALAAPAQPLGPAGAPVPAPIAGAGPASGSSPPAPSGGVGVGNP